ncbi:MAG: substrate-binding domain-containing protein [Victivallaceae bacterium]
MELVAEKSQFLYQQVRDYLTSQARNSKLEKHGRIPSERDLADKLNISRGTVRMALGELEKSGFIERIPYKGAFICQAGKKRTIRLALVFPEAEMSQGTLDYASWAADNEIWRGMLNACPQLNAVLTFLYCSPKDDSKYFEDFADNLRFQYDGALFIGPQLSGLRKALEAIGFPFVSLFDDAEDAKNNICYDRVEACELAAKHLLECGCKNISLLGMGSDVLTWPLKKSVFRRIFAEAGFWIPDENIINIPGENEMQCLKTLMETFPADGRLPDAFFCSTPIISFALLRLANERNWRIPQDFMIMGYANNMQLRPTVPLLTHIRIPYFNMGYAGCEILINSIINGEKLPVQEIVHADLIIGATTYNKSERLSANLSCRQDHGKINRQELIYAERN